MEPPYNCLAVGFMMLFSFRGKHFPPCNREEGERREKNPYHSFRALHHSVCCSASSSHPFCEEYNSRSPRHPPQPPPKKLQHVERMYTLAERALMCSAAASSRSIMHGCVSVTSPGDTTRCRACGGKSKRLHSHSLTLSICPQVPFFFFFPSASRRRDEKKRL